ncbi:MAG: ATP-binding protein [Alphaproteobacteria bacterium]
MRVSGSSRIVGLVAALCVLCVALAVWTLSEARKAALDEGLDRTAGRALMLEYHASLMLAGVEQFLESAAEKVVVTPAGEDFAPTLARFLAEAAARLPQLRRVEILNTEGVAYTGEPSAEAPPPTYATAAFFRSHTADPSSRQLVVEPAPDLRIAGESLQLSRRLDRVDGSFAGVLLAEIDMNYLRELYARLRPVPDDSVALVTTAGRMVLRVPFDPAYVGRDFSHGEMLSRQVPQAAAGTFRTVSPVDGRMRLIGYRTVPGYPLVVFATSAEDRVLAGWRASFVWYALVIAGLLLLVGVSAVHTVREVRQRRAAERTAQEALADLTRQKAMVDAILNALPDGTQLFDPRQRMIGWNDRLFQLLAVDRADVFAATDSTHRFFEILAHRGEYGPGDIEELIRGRLEITRATEPFQYRRRMADGRWLECRGQPIPGLGTLAVYRDITAEIDHEERMRAIQGSLEDARYGAERANRAKSEFLAGMSHELRTPLNAIMGFADVIGRLYFGRHAIERYAEYGRDILDSAKHLLGLIDSLLDLAKIEAGRMELYDEPFDLADCVERGVAMCRPIAAAKGVDLDIAGLPPVSVQGDEQKVLQCVINVVSNAIKFTPADGRVVTSAELRPERLAIVVADTGIGIAPEDLPQVFEPFRQVDSALARKEKGTGLGMPLTKRFLELHGGSVEIESAPGRGTIVTMLLPRARMRARAAA